MTLTDAILELKLIMKNDVHMFNYEMRKQMKGGPIGLRLTAQISVMWRDKEFTRRLSQTRVIQSLNERSRYVDDINMTVQATAPGLRLD